MLRDALGDLFDHWADIRDYVFKNSPGAEEVWYFFKVGWHIRIRNNKRVIIYCIPAEEQFAILFVLGERAMQEALTSNLSAPTRQLLQAAGSHSEGYRFYMEVKDESNIKDIKKLIAIKLFIKA